MVGPADPISARPAAKTSSNGEFAHRRRGERSGARSLRSPPRCAAGCPQWVLA